MHFIIEYETIILFSTCWIILCLRFDWSDTGVEELCVISIIYSTEVYSFCYTEKGGGGEAGSAACYSLKF